MHLHELIQTFPKQAASSVPGWMLGCFRRRNISFANGSSDPQTFVCWLQSRNFTIDLRLPKAEHRPQAKPWEQYSAEELQALANYEGWQADCEWNNGVLSWKDAVSLQWHNRWSEPAQLSRVGNCMIEFAPSGAYVEDWRLQPTIAGPLVGLRLLQERDLASGLLRHQGGGLIICGEYAGWVAGRAQPVLATMEANEFRQMVAAAVGQTIPLKTLFNFETSLARGSLAHGYEISHSTCPNRVGKSLLELDGFEFCAQDGLLMQRCNHSGHEIERVFSIDTLEPEVAFTLDTEMSETAQVWLQQEAETLQRYAELIH